MLQQAVERIHTDYINRRPPFDDVQFPEDETIDNLEPLTTEQTACLLTFGSSINYNRNTTDLWQKLTVLGQTTDCKAYDPEWIASHTERVEELFADIRTRYPNRDAEYWITNASELLHHHEGSIETLVQTHQTAGKIIEHVRNHPYKGVSGDKIAPMWVRYLHEYAYPVDELDTLPIPVDVHIHRLTERLTGTEFNENADVHAFWDDICRSTQTTPIQIGKPLWLIGKHWEDWGADYFTEVRTAPS